MPRSATIHTVEAAFAVTATYLEVTGEVLLVYRSDELVAVVHLSQLVYARMEDG